MRSHIPQTNYSQQYQVLDYNYNQPIYQQGGMYNQPPADYHQGFDIYQDTLRDVPPTDGGMTGQQVNNKKRKQEYPEIGTGLGRQMTPQEIEKYKQKQNNLYKKEEPQYRALGELNKDDLLIRLRDNTQPSYSVLNEYCKKVKKQVEYTYLCLDRNRATNAIFECVVKLDGIPKSKGNGTNKKEARDYAAQACFKDLFELEPFSMQFVDHWISTINTRLFKSRDPEYFTLNKKDIVEDINKNFDLGEFQHTYNYREELSDFCQQRLKCQFRFVMEKKDNENIAYVYIGEDCESGSGKCVKSARNYACYKMLCKLANTKGIDYKPKDQEAPSERVMNQGALKIQHIEQMKLKQMYDKPDYSQGNNNADSKRESLPAPRIDQIGKQNVNTAINTQVNYMNLSVNSPELDMKYDSLNNDNFTIIQRALDEDEKLNDFFRCFDMKIAATYEEYKLLNEILEELYQFQDTILKLNFHSVFPIGLYNLKALQRTQLVSEISANYKVMNLDGFNFKIIAQNFKSVFENLLKSSIPIEINGVQSIRSRIEVDESNKTIKIRHPHPKVNAHVLMRVEPMTEKYSDYVHHYIWLQELIKANIPNNQQMNDDIRATFRLIRYFHQAHKVKVPIEILDFIFYVVSNGFKLTKISRNIVYFFRFIAQQGLQDLKFQKKNLCKIDKLHDRIYQKVEQSDIQDLEKVGKEIYYNLKYEDVFNSMISTFQAPTKTINFPQPPPQIGQQQPNQ